jgi:hypothetical protein
MPRITPELRQAIEDAGENPPQIVDPQTNTTYVLICADVYEHIRSLLEPGEGMTPAEMAPLLWEVMKGDRDDPSMDAYDRYPEE